MNIVYISELRNVLPVHSLPALSALNATPNTGKVCRLIYISTHNKNEQKKGPERDDIKETKHSLLNAVSKGWSFVLFVTFLLKKWVLYPSTTVYVQKNRMERNFITPARAMNEFHLKSSDLETLKKTERRSAYENEPPITVYWLKDVEAK
jgi:hypothetical protein